jgi:Cys-rich repeat protein
MTRTIIWGISISLALAAGCRPPEPEDFCREDADCALGELCRDAACITPECEVSSDCAAGACNDGLCEACGSASDCEEGEVCSGGDCVPRECIATTECSDGLACRDGVCLPCTYDGECEIADACHHGECVTRECTLSDGCTDGQLCDMGVCSPCGPTLACEGLLACIEGACAPCTEDTDCGGEGYQCRSGQCYQSCALGGGCGDPGVLGCRGASEARPCGEQFCGGDYRVFTENAFCDACLSASGGCRMGTCDDDLLCPCATSADCPDELACNGGRCGACGSDAQCGCDRYCAGGECHDRCTSDADCPRGRCDPSGGRCVPCLTDSDCGSGQRCFEDGCQGLCGSGDIFSCAPFVPCGSNQRCGLCAECAVGSPRIPVPACP